MAIAVRRDACKQGLVQDEIRQVAEFVETTSCKRRVLLQYFGEPLEKDSAICFSCKSCSSCLREGGPQEPKLNDYTNAAKIFLQMVIETSGKYGATKMADLLKGSNTAFIRDKGLAQSVASYGKGAEMSKEVWKLLHRKLQPKFLKVGNPNDRYPVYVVTTDGKKVLDNELKAMLNVEL